MKYEVKIHAPADLSEKWYVYVYSEGKIVKKIYRGLAKETNYTDRMVRAELLKAITEKELKEGWKPSRKSLPQPYQENLTVLEAYEKAWGIIESSKLELKTKRDYRTHRNFFIEAVSKLKWEDALFSELDAFHFTTIIERMAKTRGGSNSFYNKHLAICKSYSKYLKKHFIIKENKVLGIPEKEYKSTEKKLLTPKEQTTIIIHFKEVCPAFNVYLKTLYHLAIRPKELRLLTCSMIKQNGEIWYFELPEEITKNDKKGVILIPDDLKKDLKQYNLSNPDYFLFGKNFTPSPIQQAVNRANKLWKQEVKDKLGIQSDMYWLKSKSSNDKMRNGMSLEAVRIANRHSDKEITKIYATESDFITLEQNLDKFGKFE